jgi:predicted AlkP superfamily pyrophosphatase or phosphodiesterase
MFSFAGDKDRDTLLKVHANPKLLFPTDTIYRDLSNHGVQAYVLQDHQYTHSPYTEVVTGGAQLVPYRSLPEAIVTLAELLKRQNGPSYYFLYYDKIDSVSHHHGPAAPHTAAEIEATLFALESFLVPAMRSTKGDALFLMTADHAHIGIDPQTTVYLNEAMPEIIPLLRRSRSGELIIPAGSPRDMFLHIVEGKLNDACEMLTEKLAGRAEVHRTDDLIAEGFFGSTPPSSAFMSRVGDLVILPYAEETVWWHEPGRFEQKYYGSHGGLTPEEMETVLLVQPF